MEGDCRNCWSSHVEFEYFVTVSEKIGNGKMTSGDSIFKRLVEEQSTNDNKGSVHMHLYSYEPDRHELRK